MGARMRQIDVLEYLIRKGPGRSETELTRAMHGGLAHQKRLDGECARLVEQGKIERRGPGVKSDPYRYWPIGVRNAAREEAEPAAPVGGAQLQDVY